MSVTKTHYIKHAIDYDNALSLFLFLKDNIEWEDGIKTRYGECTRKAKPLDHIPPEINTIYQIVAKQLPNIGSVLGIYINYYADGTHYCPMHTHTNTRQLVISLGATRTFKLGQKTYMMGNGDAILFGSSSHGIPKEPHITDGRISIAIFLDK